MPKKVAAIVTEYRKWSHADVILRNLLDGYPDGKRPGSRTRVALHRSGAEDRHEPRPGEEARLHDLRDHRRLPHARRQDARGRGRALHRRARQLSRTTRRARSSIRAAASSRRSRKVFEKSGKVVPVFNDKHLAATWDDAKWMYDRARKLMFPFLAGSSIPVTWRKPEPDAAEGLRTRRARCRSATGPFEGYGFHALEGLQCMVERRKGGETGVKAVTCHTGKAMWEALDKHAWTKPLLDAMVKLVTGARQRATSRELTAKDEGRGYLRDRVPRRFAGVRRHAQRLDPRGRRRRRSTSPGSARASRSPTSATSTCSSPTRSPTSRN